MKALVVSNCATSSYVHGLRSLFPDWEVRGAISKLAEQWTSPDTPRDDFIQYLRDCDIYVGLPLQEAQYGRLLSERSRHVPIPPFWFRGLQPDCFHLTGFKSALGAGNLYSRIVVASFQLGLSIEQSCNFFADRVYEELGFFLAYEKEKHECAGRYARYGIDISNSFERWIARGNFLYSYNHPRIDVLMEILCRALAAAGLLDDAEIGQDRDLGVVDELKESLIWPVYPEIARAHGIEGSLIWRQGQSLNYRALDLRQFVENSFGELKARPLPDLPELTTSQTALAEYLGEARGAQFAARE